MDTHRQTHTISPRSQTKYQMLQAITDSNFNSINLSIIEEEMFQIFNFFWSEMGKTWSTFCTQQMRLPIICTLRFVFNSGFVLQDSKKEKKKKKKKILNFFLLFIS